MLRRGSMSLQAGISATLLAVEDSLPRLTSCPLLKWKLRLERFSLMQIKIRMGILIGTSLSL